MLFSVGVENDSFCSLYYILRFAKLSLPLPFCDDLMRLSFASSSERGKASGEPWRREARGGLAEYR